MTVAAIHQPTFLPWLGWWDKLVRSDVFVLLDEVQFPKKGGTWMNRVRILRAGRPEWLTLPVDRAYHGVRPVREMRVDRSKEWRAAMLSRLDDAYAGQANYSAARRVVVQALGVSSDLIVEINEHAIAVIADVLQLDTSKIVRQSELAVRGSGTQLLVDICRTVGADAYLTGDGAGGYLEPERFPPAGLHLLEQQFVHPRYPQAAPDFIPGLSVVDALVGVGQNGTRALLS